ncbi:MAG: cadherin-like domain-containing protein [Gemmataceae bacterium]|nr:cadherin-like domain-containing protein [Gemmataceae bacterium]
MTINHTKPANGYAEIDFNGTPDDPSDDTIVYTPDPDYYGSDSFEYSITDIWGRTDTGTVTITVTSVNDAPTLESDRARRRPGELLFEFLDALACGLELLLHDEEFDQPVRVDADSLCERPPGRRLRRLFQNQLHRMDSYQRNEPGSCPARFVGSDHRHPHPRSVLDVDLLGFGDLRLFLFS